MLHWCCNREVLVHFLSITSFEPHNVGDMSVAMLCGTTQICVV